ncbi:sensor histidine kinase [Flavobacterium sp. J27]|uniref:tetratricopeptide repeat-containing sensor histidine kinase n=1 Tax=Flavobacterium sp. J27 TaxID=2060419 RepID=UPI0010309A33|nr:sensor histidine kinase [Flavobacterium sp. J27]
MKSSFIAILFLLVTPCLAQVSETDKKIHALEKEIKNSNGSHRLTLLDSLATYIYYHTSEENDSIFKVTIAYAKELDSINIVVKQATHLLELISYNSQNFDEGKSLIASTNTVLQQASNLDIVEEYYTYVANFYYQIGDFDQAIKIYNQALVSAQKYNSKRIGEIKFRKGVIYVDKGDFGKASLNLKEAITYFQRENDTLSWIDAKMSMSILYSKSGFYKESKKERKEQIDLARKLKSYNNLGLIYFNMAADDNKEGLQNERISNLKLALKSNEKSKYKDYFEPIFKATLTVAYAENDSLEKAANLLTALEKNREAFTNNYNDAFYLEAKKQVLFAQNKFPQAIHYGKQYLELKKQGKQYEEIQEAEKFLAKAYEKVGNDKEALLHYKNFTHIKDSIENIQKIRVLAYYQTLYETKKRDLTIENQKANIALLDSKNKIMQQWGLFGGLGLVSIFGFLYILRSRNFAKSEQKAQEKFTQDIIIAQEEERTRVALELHDSVGQQLMLLTRKSKNSNDPSMEVLAKDALQSIRSISQGLHPVVLERLGFTAGINDLIHTIDANTDLFFTVDIEPIDSFLDKDKSLHVYRIIQEVLTNIIKHAQATSVTIDIHKVKSSIKINIEDNGKGFDFEQQIKISKSLGMKSLIERSKIIIGKLNINSTLNEGTITQLTFPV